MDGRQLLLGNSLRHQDASRPRGREQVDGFTGYDPDKKVYTETEFTSQGGSGVTQGTLNGDTWTWTWTEKLPNGQVIQHRGTDKMLSPTTYSGKDSVSEDGIKWLVIMESTVTKK